MKLSGCDIFTLLIVFYQLTWIDQYDIENLYFRYILAASLQQVILSLINFSARRRRRQAVSPSSVSPPLTPAAEKESSLVNVSSLIVGRTWLNSRAA